MKRHRIKTRCRFCKRIRFVTPLYKIDRQERYMIKNHYLCSDCEGKEPQ